MYVPDMKINKNVRNLIYLVLIKFDKGIKSLGNLAKVLKTVLKTI